jgi:hypothetical protein
MPMASVDYDTLVANIAQVNVDGPVVRVGWRCPVSGRSMGQSEAAMLADSSVTGRVGANVKRSVASEIIYGSARFLAGLLPGAAGRIFNNAVYTAAADISTKATAGSDVTEASRRAAIVTAFQSVKDQFVWDEQRQKFVAL